MSLARPEWLWLLWLVPLWVALQVWNAKRRRRALNEVIAPPLTARLTPLALGVKGVLKRALVSAALMVLILALAGWQYGQRWEKVSQRGADLVVALDVSRSMLAKDATAGGQTARLVRAKREFRDLIQRLQGDRIGLVAFAGDAFLECPLTLDYAAAELFLRELGPDFVPVEGSAVGRAIAVAMDAFPEKSGADRAILLVTDGEDHAGEALDAVKRARAEGVRIFTMGVGRPAGTPIPGPDGRLIRDRNGELVLSRLNTELLQQIADRGDGRYVRARHGDADIDQIYTETIASALQHGEHASSKKRRKEDRFQWLVGLAMALLAIEPLIGERTGGQARNQSGAST